MRRVGNAAASLRATAHIDGGDDQPGTAQMGQPVVMTPASEFRVSSAEQIATMEPRLWPQRKIGSRGYRAAIPARMVAKSSANWEKRSMSALAPGERPLPRWS